MITVCKECRNEVTIGEVIFCHECQHPEPDTVELTQEEYENGSLTVEELIEKERPHDPLFWDYIDKYHAEIISHLTLKLKVKELINAIQRRNYPEVNNRVREIQGLIK